MSKKWIKKGTAELEAASQDGPSTSPFLTEPSTGPTYDKFFLLGVATAVKKAAEDEQPGLNREVSLTARTDSAAKELSGADKAKQRAYLKEAKAARRTNSGLNVDDDPDAVGSLAVNGPTTPSGNNPMADPAMMTYLQSMYAMSQMAAYGAVAAGYTTVMLRNIPNRYTREMLVKRLDDGYKGQYDFVYLPIDFESTCNVGYVFINFRTPYSAANFLAEFHNAETKKVLPGFSTRKVCEVSYARVQGLEANIDNLRDEKFIDKLAEKPEWQPLFLDAKGEQIPFAKMMSKKPKSGKTPKGGGMTPLGGMGGFMMPGPYGPMYPPYGAPSTPSMPSTSLSTILPSASGETMLFVRGVPLTLMRSELVELLNEKFTKLFDFVFLPPDVKFSGNKGIFFINFREKEKTADFKEAFHEKLVSECFPKFVPVEGEEAKQCSVEPAKVDVVEGIIARTQTSPPPAKQGVDRSKWQPVLFAPDGEQLTFPLIAAPGAGARSAKTPKAKAAAAAPSEDAKPEASDGEIFKPIGGEEGEAPSADAAGSGDAPAPKAKAKGEKGSKGKGKDNAKGKGKGMYPYGGYPGNPYGFMPGYPYGMHPMAMQAYASQLQAHMQARAAATANAAGAGGDPSKLSAEDKKKSLMKQVDFYFSVDNLCKDVFLRQQMDEDGYCKLELIANFNLVKRKYMASVDDIAEAVAGSSAVELSDDKTKVRLRDPEQRQKWRFPRAEDTAK